MPESSVRFSSPGGRPARLAWLPQLGDAQHADRARLAALRAQWERRGVTVRERVVGGVYGVAGRVIDTRRSLLLATGDGSETAARAFGDAALARYGARTATSVEVRARPAGRVEAEAAGAPLASGEALLTLEVEGDAGFLLDTRPGGTRARGHAGRACSRQVVNRRWPHSAGDRQGRPEEPGNWAPEERPYRGRLHVTLDASGRLAAVLALGLEELLRGLVPSEIPAGAAPAALAAQAVAARSNVLAQLGTRHLDAPWLLCDQVHCQAYHGERAQAASTDAAVRATAGEALFGRRDRRLVDGVYSAVCGGHGEDDDAVWPVLATPALRGRPDLPPEAPPPGDLRGERPLRAFVESSPPAWCARARAIPPRRFRWERRLGESELDRLVAPLRVGHVRDLTVLARGVSGRARALRVTGTGGRAVVEGELVIRRLLGNLPSAMFVVGREGEEVVLRGGGWGHGVGLCQWGAIGRAEAGQGYREILSAYYAGAEVARVY